MFNQCISITSSTLLAVNIVGIAASVNAAPVTPGNLLSSKEDNTITEYTLDGTFVQSFTVPYPISSATERARDLVVDS